MPEIKAADVKRLRDATGAGMMDCKRALEEADGDFDRAATLVRERTGARMDARVGGRTAGEGLVHSYLHAPQPGLPAKIGVLLELNCETDFVAKSDGFRQLASDIAMHIAAANPAVVREEEVDPDEVAREREFAQNQARSEGKPDHIIERIVDGRLKSYFKEQVLLNQPFVRDDSKTVGDLVSEVQRTTGERVEVRRFARFQIGR